ncbi:hypothetical protein BGZ63DRAFT_411598 [Mariannaea sp. PMI_226]|nr:hypothetical protein BGZ63DRAFT_411598 [Mariannaea sp. PMI_226]
MAEADHAQSHSNSASISLAPGSGSPSAASAVSSVIATTAATNAAIATATAISSPASPSGPPSASTSTSSTRAALTDDDDNDDEKPLAVPSASSPEPTSTYSLASSPAAPQQNGDSRAPEPEPEPEPNSTLETEMSNQHPGASHGLPVSYPGPANPYPSTVGVSTAHYASYPAVTTQPPDGYRSSPIPVGSNVMSLPSMRTIDSMSHQQGPPAGAPQALGMNIPMAPVQAGVPFYGHHNMSMAPGYALPSDPMARYALPHDPRLLGHRGPKKDEDRLFDVSQTPNQGKHHFDCHFRCPYISTSLACDETHPTCNNCKKSKRECLGYDPIFRQQPGNQTTSHIQPAPSSQITPPSVPSSLPPTIPSSVPSNPALTARATNSYGNQPSMLPSSYAPTHVSAASSPSVSTSSHIYNQYPVKSESGYEYPSAIDPALQTLPSTKHSLTRMFSTAKMKIDGIIDQLGPAPPARQINPTEEIMGEITKVYHEIYVLGLSSFFETNWYYFAESGKMSFPRDPKLVELMATFLEILKAVKANDHAQMASSGILETRLVWELARLSYQNPDPPAEAVNVLPSDSDAKEAKNRVRVLEALLCGEYLSANPLTSPLPDPDPHRTRQFDFWYNLAEFVRLQDEPNSAAATKAREDILSRMRNLLDGRENRDVLYSIAVVRELAPNYEPGYGATLPYHLDESDPKNRLAVATKFILSEAQVTGGTTNVVRRFSDIASRAFVNPGVNIGRGP